jgi:NADPH2:quinone reductase
MPHAIAADAPGGPEVLQWRAVATPDPGPGEIRIRQTAVGVNFIDVYFRQGSYPWPAGGALIPGCEGAGVVEAVGAGVTGRAVGDRVAYVVRNGGYATHRLLPADQAVGVPDGVTDDQAAAVMLKGLTAHYLIHHSYAVQAGDTVLVHAAAGGVGLLVGQWLAARGVTAIGTAGGAEKCALAAAHGYAHVIDYRSQDFVAEVARITGGKGLQAVYDSVGRDTMAGSLKCLAPFGTCVSFGQSSGAPDDIRVAHLGAASLRLTRPSLFSHTAQPGWLARAAADLFAAIADGTLKVRIAHRWPLAEAAAAHRALEGRQTTGSIVLQP